MPGKQRFSIRTKLRVENIVKNARLAPWNSEAFIPPGSQLFRVTQRSCKGIKTIKKMRNMDMKKTPIILFALGAALAAWGQAGRDCYWLLGYFDGSGSPGSGNFALDFCGGSLEVYEEGEAMSFFNTNAGMSSEAGELLFYTNGVFVIDAQRQPMLGGEGLNPGGILGSGQEGHIIPQGALALPFPGRERQYALFHQGLSYPDLPDVSQGGSPLYLTVIDMALEGGLGAVVEKNTELSGEAFDFGKLAAVRHANGRDWWVVVPEAAFGRLFRYLLSPDGVTEYGADELWLLQKPGPGAAAFSPDGRYYAQVSNYLPFSSEAYVDILEFDRCTGAFAPVAQHAFPSFLPGALGLAFSPNSRFLYLSRQFDIVQFDLADSDIIGSQAVVLEPDEEGGSLALAAQLAPDGKIYFAGIGTELSLHAIAQPDLPGPDCNAQWRALPIPAFNAALPNFPNYRLGALEDSPCDSIMTSSVERAAGWSVRLWPNPAQGHCMVSLEQAEAAGAPPQQSLSLQLFDSLGRLLRQEAWPAGAPEWRLSLAGLPPGVYYASIRAEGQAVAVERLVVVR
jgi:hypothetical protein